MIVALLLALAASPPLPTAPPPAPPAGRATTLYVITYAQGPRWIAGQPMQRQNLLGHFRYMQQLLRDGRLVAGGPFAGESAGMALIRAHDAAAARAILAADPAVIEGVFTGSVRAWNIAIDSRRPLTG